MSEIKRKTRKSKVKKVQIDVPVVEEPIVEEPIVEESSDEEEVVKEEVVKEKVVKEKVVKAPRKKRGASPYNKFVSENMKTEAIKNLPAKQRFSAISALWKKSKE